MNIGRRALVYSVPGTGTRFTNNLLEEVFGYRKVGPRELVKEPVNSQVYTHLHVNAGTYLDLIKEMDPGKSIGTIIPLRSPVAQYITRHREMEKGERARVEALRLWNLLKESVERYDYVFLPIEETRITNREKVARVAEHLETYPLSNAVFDFCAKWEKVGSSGPKPERELYDRTGSTEVDGGDVAFLDSLMSWYWKQVDGYLNGGSS